MEMLNRIYKGFVSEDEVFTFLKEINYTKESVVKVIKFKGMYYVVGVDLETRFVAGKDMIFVTDAKFMTMMDLNRFKSLKPEFPIIQEARYNYLDGFYREMIKEDFDLCVYSIEGDGDFLMLCESNDSSNAYVVNLGMTFCKISYSRGQLGLLDRYVKDSYLYETELYDKYINVQAVYPSLNTVVFKYQNKNEVVRTRIDYTENGAVLVLQDNKFGIKKPINVKSANKQDNTVVNKQVVDDGMFEKVIYELSNIKDGKSYYGFHDVVRDADEILNDLFLEMDKGESELAKAMLSYNIGDFIIRIIKKDKFKKIDDCLLSVATIIGETSKDLLTPTQKMIKKVYMEQNKN